MHLLLLRLLKRSTVINTPPTDVVPPAGADSQISTHLALILTLLLVLGSLAISACLLARYIFLRRRGRLQIRRRGLSELTMRRFGIWIEKDGAEGSLVRPRFYEVGLGGGEKELRLDGLKEEGAGGGGKEEEESLPLSIAILPSSTFSVSSSSSSSPPPLLLLSILILPPTNYPFLYYPTTSLDNPTTHSPLSPPKDLLLPSASSLSLDLELPEIQIGSILIRLKSLSSEEEREEWEGVLKGVEEEEMEWEKGEGRLAR